MKKKHISIILIMLILLMTLIFCFSAQPVDESTITSTRVCRWIAKLMFSRYSTYEGDVQRTIIKGLTHIVRKAAHFSEYAVMGFLWYLLLRKKRMNILLSISATMLYAATDEFHQTFVDGRSGQLSDVLLDTCGGCFGILIAFLTLCVWYCCTDKSVMEYGVWKNKSSGR